MYNFNNNSNNWDSESQKLEGKVFLSKIANECYQEASKYPVTDLGSLAIKDMYLKTASRCLRGDAKLQSKQRSEEFHRDMANRCEAEKLNDQKTEGIDKMQYPISNQFQQVKSNLEYDKRCKKAFENYQDHNFHNSEQYEGMHLSGDIFNNH